MSNSRPTRKSQRSLTRRGQRSRVSRDLPRTGSKPPSPGRANRRTPANLIDLDTDESAIISIAGSNLLLPFFRDVVKGRIAGIETSLIGAKTICVDGRHQTLLAVPVKVFHCHCSTVHRMVKAVPRGLANHIFAEYRSDQEKCGKRGRIPHLPRNLIVYTVTFVSTRGTRMPES